jgi:hypothetical protein
MAEELKRRYDIVVLKVEMRDTRPDVVFTLQAKVEGRLADIKRWESDITDLVLKRDRRNVSTGSLPSPLVDDLTAWMLDEVPPATPLWVHLVRPYGALRFMPWERAFGSTFGRAILMLPDFLFPPPRENAETLDVVLCASAPLGVEDWHVRTALRDAIDRILNAGVRRTNLHVFIDNAFYKDLHAELEALTPAGASLRIYNPQDASQFCAEDQSSRLVDQSGQLRSPWLLWMQHSLRNCSVDVVHLIGHGYLSRDRGAMLFAQSPLERTNEFCAGPVSAIELSNYMTRVGAWATVLTGVMDNNSPAGMRALADEIGQTRPGPVLMHSLDRDPGQMLLAPAYQVLFDDTPMAMPVSDALFVYCQPYRVQATSDTQPVEPGVPPDKPQNLPRNPPSVAPEPQRTRSMRTLESPVSRSPAQTAVAAASSERMSPLDRVFESGGRVKSWVAATERVAEQVQLKLQKDVRDDATADPIQEARAAASISALDSLRESVASFATEDAAAAPIPPAGAQ